MLSIRKVASSRSLMAAIAALGVVALGVEIAEAQAGRNRSFGSRGTQTFTAPKATNTAPRAAQPIQRSTVQPGMAGRGVAAPGSRFGSSFGGMLMGGLLGAGLFGLLSGSGLFGGAAGLAGMLGLLLQVALIGGAVWLVMSFLRNRRAQPAVATPMARQGMPRQGMVGQGQPYAATPAGGFGGAPAAAAAPATQPLALDQADYDAFERLLVRIQDSYGREDIPALRAIATPEMANYLSEDIAENQRKGMHNVVSDAKLLQGDLSEAWREADGEYATVAMRFSLISTDVERGTGRIVSGSSDQPIELTEIWTFQRRTGSNANGWKLSAIQQTE